MALVADLDGMRAALEARAARLRDEETGLLLRLQALRVRVDAAEAAHEAKGKAKQRKRNGDSESTDPDQSGE